MDYKQKLINNLNNNIFCRLSVINNNIGMVALRDIPINTNPFVLNDTLCSNCQFIPLTQSDISILDDPIKHFLQRFYDIETDKYYVPYFGINSINIVYYTKINNTENNLEWSDLDRCQVVNFKTNRDIRQGEELIIPGFKFNVELILKHVHNYDKNELINNLKNTYCLLSKSSVGIGVISIKEIPININPFQITSNSCINYNGILLSKKDVKNLKHDFVKKLITDFISINENNEFYVPYLGFNSLNITFFLNHSSNNNLEILSDNCEYMGFITKYNIKSNEELFINYQHYHNEFLSIMQFTPI